VLLSATFSLGNHMLILLDYPSIHDVRTGSAITGFPATMLGIAMRYAGMPKPPMTFLFNSMPKFSNPSSYFHPKKNCPDEARGNPVHYQFGYLRSEFLPDYHRVRDECSRQKFIVAMGDLALWCLTGDKMLDVRGTILYWQDIRVIATHNPRAILKDHSLLPVLAMDLRKAWQESLKPRSVFPRRTLHIVESPSDMERCIEACMKAGSFAFDVETKEKQITVICFAPSPREVYVVPFWNGSQTVSFKEEVLIWGMIQILMLLPLRRIAQNAVFDLTFLDAYGLTLRYPVDDTMLKSHSNEIEWPKGLGFLGSIYCNEKSWKLMRVGKVKDRNKKDE